MSLVERAAEVRGWTRPGRPVSMNRLVSYGHVAALWEVYRLRCRRSPVPADDRKFVELSATVRGLAADLGLTTCTDATANADGVPGITDRNGFLPGDPARILYQTWSDQ